MSRLLPLTEWTESAGHLLEPDDVAALRSALPNLQFIPEAAGRYTVRSASNQVGAIQVADFAVTIAPSKCSPTQVVFMLGYATGATAFQEEQAPFDSDDNVWEAMVRAFSHQLARAVRRGVHRGYRHEDDALSTIRGRVRIEDQLRRQYRLAPPIEVSYDEYTEDITENRVLKAALLRCHQLPLRSAELRSSLRHHEYLLANVQHVYVDARQQPSVSWSRLNEHLRPAFELARLILKNTSIALAGDSARSPGFLVDMAKVFEDFVVAGLRDTLGLDALRFPQEVTGRLRLADNIPLKPDFSWWSGDRCLAVGDVKYKATTAEGVLHPDLYQVFAYSVSAQVPDATLIYAKSKAGQVGDEAARVHHVSLAGKHLRVEVLDLDNGPEVALTELRRVAHTIARHSLVAT
jgi:5-methylcytosine-specific restriction enzyme subunit McrC